MAFTPKSFAPVRVEPVLLPFVRFVWPGRQSPTGIIGVGQASSIGAGPPRYAFATSHSPKGASEAFTLMACVTFSGALQTGVGVIAGTMHVTSLTGGFQLDCRSGRVRWSTLDAANGGGTLADNITTESGTAITFGAVSTQSHTALFVNGTLTSSATSTVGSWTVQNTLNVGWTGASDVWSGGVADVVLFAKALTPDEVWQQHQFMRV